MDQERKGEMKRIMRKCHGKGDKINSHEKIGKTRERECVPIEKIILPQKRQRK